PKSKSASPGAKSTPAILPSRRTNRPGLNPLSLQILPLKTSSGAAMLLTFPFSYKRFVGALIGQGGFETQPAVEINQRGPVNPGEFEAMLVEMAHPGRHDAQPGPQAPQFRAQAERPNSTPLRLGVQPEAARPNYFITWLVTHQEALDLA